MSDPAKQATMASVGLMSLTAMGSSSIGERIGTAIAKIVAWEMAVKCQCVPPEDIVSAVHEICFIVVVGLAFLVHRQFAKNL